MGKPNQKGDGKRSDKSGDGKGKGNAKGKGKAGESPKGGGKGGKGKSSKAKPAVVTAQKEDNTQIEREKTQVKDKKLRAKKVEEDRMKDFLYAEGTKCNVRKHTEMGCAVVTMQSQSARDYILAHAEKTVPKEGKEARPCIHIKDKTLQMRPYVDKDAQEDVVVDIFVAWGRQAEKQAPLSAATIADAFDKLVEEAGDAINTFVAPPSAIKPVAPKPPPPPPVAASSTGAAAAVPTPSVQQMQQFGARMAAAQQMGMQMAAAHMAQQLVQQQQMMQMAAAQMAMASTGESAGTDISELATTLPTAPAKERSKAFKIVDPGNGEEIPSASSSSGMRIGAKAFVPSAPEPTPAEASPTSQANLWERKTLKIIDPKSGEAIAGISSSGMRADAREFVPPSAEEEDSVAMQELKPGEFVPASEKKTFQIMDPRSGAAIAPPAKP